MTDLSDENEVVAKFNEMTDEEATERMAGVAQCLVQSLKLHPGRKKISITAGTVFHDSSEATDGKCQACGDAVRFGPKTQEASAKARSEGQLVIEMCLVCAAIAGVLISELGGPHGHTVEARLAEDFVNETPTP